MIAIIARKSGNLQASSATGEYDGLDFLRSAETDAEFVNRLEIAHSVVVALAKPDKISNLQPRGTFHILAERYIANGYAVVPASPFSKMPAQPARFGGDIVTRESLQRDINWRTNHDLDPVGGIPDGAWIGGPRFHGLKDWRNIRHADLVPGGHRHSDFCRWVAGAALPGGRYLGIGVVTSRHVIAIDVDSRDPEIVAKARAFLDTIPGPVIERVGSKGFARFYRVEGAGVESQRLGGFDVLANGDFCVLPDSFHPGANRDYRWTGNGTLLEVAAGELPVITREEIEAVAEIVSPGALAAKREAATNRAASKVLPTCNEHVSFADRVSAEALNAPAWVFKLARVARPAWAGTGVEAVNLMRAGGTGKPVERRKRNLKVSPHGIKDFGSDETWSPIGLVEASEGLDFPGAVRWLANELGYSPEEIDSALREEAQRRAKDEQDAKITATMAESLFTPPVRIKLSSGYVDIIDVAREALIYFFPGYRGSELEPANDDALDASEDNAAALAAAQEVRERLREQADLVITGDRFAAVERHRAKVDAAKQTIEDFKSDPRIELAERDLADSRVALAVAETRFDQLIRADDDHAAAEARDRVRALRAEVGAAYRNLHRLRKVRRIQIREAQRVIDTPAPKSPVPVQQINVYPGLGKTTAARMELFPRLAEAGVQFVYATAAHSLAKETLAGFQAVAGDAVGTWWPGQTAVEDGEPVCKRHREAEAARKAGLSAGGLCGVAEDEDQRCPFWQSCPVWNARSGVEGRSHFTATSMLFQPRPPHVRPRVIVVDESILPLALGADAIEIELESFLTVPDLQPPKREADRQEWEWLLAAGESALRAVRERAGTRLQAVGAPMPDGSREAAMRADIGPRNAEALARLAAYVSSTLRRAALTAKSNLADIECLAGRAVSIRTAEAWAAFAEECLHREYNTETGRIRFIERDGKVLVRILPLSRVHSSWLEPEAGVERIILLNGTPERTEWLRDVFSYQKRGRVERPRFLPAIEITRPPLARTVHVEQWRGAPFASSKLGLTNRKRANVDLGAHNRLMLSAIVSKAVAEAGADKSVIIAPEKLRSAIFAGAGANMLERGKSAGTNDYERASLVVYVDAYQPPEAVREKAMRLTGRWLMPDQWSMSADREYLPDDDTAASYLRWERRSAALQAAERCRTRWVKIGEDGKPIRSLVIIVSDAANIFPDGEVTVRQWGSVKGGGLKAEACDYAAIVRLRAEFAELMANGGVVTTHRALMAAVHGRGFDDRHLSRLMAIGAETSHFPEASASTAIYSRGGFPMHFVRMPHQVKFRQKPANGRNWTTAFVRDDASKSLIYKHFSGAVEFQGEAVEGDVSPNTTSHFPTSHFPTSHFPTSHFPTSHFPGIIPLSWREYAESHNVSEWKAKAAVAALKADAPEGARIVAVSFEGGRGSATPYLVDAGLSDQEAVAAIEAATGGKVKEVR